MSISVNGQSQVPPGFRFHPTEEELLQYYLKKKVGLEKIDLDVIQDVDLNKLEPWDIQEKCRIGTTPQNDWYFFSHKDKKYPTGTRTNRATCSGFWKATGRDKVIYGNSRRIGMRKTLVFYKGRAPHGQKSDWIMHEYRLDDNTNTNTNSTYATVCNGNGNGEGGQEEGWVVCRVFKKKHLGLAGHKVPDIPTWSPSSTINSSSCNEGCLEEMLQSMATPSRRDHALLQPPDNNMTSRRFLKLPGLNSSSSCRTNCYQPLLPFQMFAGEDTPDFPPFISPPPDIQDWAALDRLVASHLNGPSDGGAKQHLSNDNIDPRMSFIVDDNDDHHQMLNSQQQQQQQQQRSSSSSRRYGVGGAQDYQNEGDLWGFAPKSNDQICDVSSVHPI